MKLIIISGHSGSGKSATLHCLEDLGYYCIDNLPVGMIKSLADEITDPGAAINRFAISIDARNLTQDLSDFPNLIQQLREQQIECEVIFLEAEHSVLLKRYSETRRKHPLSSSKLSLNEAIITEQQMLTPIAREANLRIDSSQLSLHQLRDMIKRRVDQRPGTHMALQLQSFGFKHGMPIDADYVFDVRCLPNPYWVHHLRQYTGQQQPVQEFLAAQPQVIEMLEDITQFVSRWLPRLEASNRSYLTVAIGCTGGQHRSVYICEQLADRLGKVFEGQITVRHRQLTQ